MISICNKKVLLRDRKRHTVRGVFCPGPIRGGGMYPVLVLSGGIVQSGPWTRVPPWERTRNQRPRVPPRKDLGPEAGVAPPWKDRRKDLGLEVVVPPPPPGERTNKLIWMRAVITEFKNDSCPSCKRTYSMVLSWCRSNHYIRFQRLLWQWFCTHMSWMASPQPSRPHTVWADQLGDLLQYLY